MSGRTKVLAGVAVVALILLGFQSFISAQFEEHSGIDLPALTVPFKYENEFSVGRRFIAIWTLPSMARRLVDQTPYWAGEGGWSNERTHVRFNRVRRLLRGNELTFGDPDYWYVYNPDSVNGEGYIERGRFILVKAGSGFVFFFDYGK